MQTTRLTNVTPPTLLAVLPALVAALVIAPACSKKEEVALAPSASALEVSKVAPAANVVSYRLQKDGKTTIDMKGVAEEIKGETSVSDGTLDVDLGNLANSRGEVKIDLTTLTMRTFADPEKNASQTDHAHNWLQVGNVATADEKRANQFVVFAIRSIDALGPSDVAKVAVETQNGEDVRKVTLTAHGELLLHGHKVNKDVPLEVRFYWPAGGKPQSVTGSPPVRVVVATKAPLVVTLGEHAVEPRDPGGKALQWTTSLISKVAKTAEVTFELTAKPNG
jgi:hypothetical protein